MFTLYKRINDTIYAACGGSIGAITAIFNSKLMVGFFPGGVVGWLCVGLRPLLYLNFGGHTHKFELTTYVCY